MQKEIKFGVKGIFLGLVEFQGKAIDEEQLENFQLITESDKVIEENKKSTGISCGRQNNINYLIVR